MSQIHRRFKANRLIFSRVDALGSPGPFPRLRTKEEVLLRDPINETDNKGKPEFPQTGAWRDCWAWGFTLSQISIWGCLPCCLYLVSGKVSLLVLRFSHLTLVWLWYYFGELHRKEVLLRGVVSPGSSKITRQQHPRINVLTKTLPWHQLNDSNLSSVESNHATLLVLNQNLKC